MLLFTENLIIMTIPAWIEKLIRGENYILVFSIIFDVSREKRGCRVLESCVHKSLAELAPALRD